MNLVQRWTPRHEQTVEKRHKQYSRGRCALGTKRMPSGYLWMYLRIPFPPTADTKSLERKDKVSFLRRSRTDNPLL